jgi:hypothetical protein
MVRRANLSVAAIKVSELEGFHRLDAEYYQPHYQKLKAQLTVANAVPVENFAYVTDGIHGSPDWVEEGGVTYLSAKCVKNNYFALADAGQISQEQNKANPRTQARVNDVLLTTVGTIGNAAVVYKDILPANMDRHLGIIRIRKGADVDPYYLATFLNSKFGRFQTLREATGNVQLNLFIEKIKILLVPLGARFNEIGNMARLSYEKYRESELLYAQAQALLTAELGLDKLDLSEGLYSVRRVSEVQMSGRADAEYFQPKYQRLMMMLSRSGRTMKDVTNLASRRFKPQPGKPFQYIEISDLSGDGYLESETLMGEDAPSRAQWIVWAGEIITSTVRPIRRLSALIEPEQNGYVCSSGFAVLQPKGIEPELLLVYLRLPIVCEILDLYTTASMYPAISTADLLSIPVTLPENKALRKDLVNIVRASRQAQRDAKRLLADAKAEVELLIEQA